MNTSATGAADGARESLETTLSTLLRIEALGGDASVLEAFEVRNVTTDEFAGVAVEYGGPKRSAPRLPLDVLSRQPDGEVHSGLDRLESPSHIRNLGDPVRQCDREAGLVTQGHGRGRAALACDTIAFTSSIRRGPE
mgnify:CR=1 FL=1